MQMLNLTGNSQVSKTIFQLKSLIKLYTLVKLYKVLLRASTHSNAQTSKKKKNDDRQIYTVRINRQNHTCLCPFRNCF